ncbi:MAG: hypothetical protein AAGA92_02025 [Planctomycetota bacterium]
MRSSLRASVRTRAGMLSLAAWAVCVVAGISALATASPGTWIVLDPSIEPQDLAAEQIVTGIVEQSSQPKWVAPRVSRRKSITAKQPSSDTDSTNRSSGIRWIKPDLVKPEENGPKLGPAQPAEPKTAAPAEERLARRPSASNDLALSTDKEAETLPQQEASDAPLATETAEAEIASASDKRPATEPAFLEVAADTAGLTQQQQRLRKKIRQVLRHYYNRPFNTRDRSPWEIMHAALAFEVHSKVLQGGPTGKPITAIGWLTFNQPSKRRTLMHFNDAGDLRVRVGPALQGHHGQLLAILAQTRVGSDYPLEVDGDQMTIDDLIEMEKLTCYPRTELTFKLIGLSHYLPSDARWVNDQGQSWDVRRLIREEIRQPVRGAACGGTHRLGGLTLAYKKRIQRGEPVDGEYLQAQQFCRKYQNYAYRLQNSDGSLSTEWFRGPGSEPDTDRRLKTTGHLLEWLLYVSTEKERAYWRTTRAANYLANLMLRNRYRDWEAGPLGHAIHALVLYDRMVFQEDLAAPSDVASQPRAGNRR